MVDSRLDGHPSDVKDAGAEVPNEVEGRGGDEQTLAAVITAFARRRSDAALTLLTAAGVVGSAVVALILPSWWRLLPPLAMAAALGAWGIADRERGAAGARRTVFTGVRIIALAVGVAAALTTALIVLRLALGTWIS